MELIRGLHNLRPLHRGCVATIGNFDGVHLGHQAVLTQLAERSAALGLPSTLVIFEPQPGEYFSPQTAPSRLTRLREKLATLQDHGVERVLCLRLSKRLAELSADEFIIRILVDGLAVKHLVVGDDFQFGKGRGGDFSSLVEAGRIHGFPVEPLETFYLDGARVSSTRVREALQQGELSRAEALLGRPYSMSGRVAHGDQRGRSIGYPTANIHLHRMSAPLGGVFAVELTGIDHQCLQGVANIGNRPTVDGTRTLLEVHLFDFNRDIYGTHVTVTFLHKLRSEQRFESFDLLKAQIDKDAEAARAFFADR